MLSQHSRGVALIAGGMLAIGQGTLAEPDQDLRTGLKDLTKNTRFIEFAAPAGTQPATTHTMVEGYRAAILPNGRYVTPAGLEISVDAPKPFGLALSADGKTLATINSGASRFSVTLITDLQSKTPTAKRIDLNATFLRDMFAGEPDFTPYTFTSISYTQGASPLWIAMSKEVDFSRPDISEVKLREAILRSEGLPHN